MTDLEYIKKFNKITLTDICKKCKVDRTNLIMGRTTKENENKVRKYIENEIAQLYIIKGKKYDKSNRSL